MMNAMKTGCCIADSLRAGARAFSGKVDTGFPQENATNKGLVGGRRFAFGLVLPEKESAVRVVDQVAVARLFDGRLAPPPFVQRGEEPAKARAGSVRDGARRRGEPAWHGRKTIARGAVKIRHLGRVRGCVGEIPGLVLTGHGTSGVATGRRAENGDAIRQRDRSRNGAAILEGEGGDLARNELIGFYESSGGCPDRAAWRRSAGESRDC